MTLSKSGLEADLRGREKTLYSIYMKMRQKHLMEQSTTRKPTLLLRRQALGEIHSHGRMEKLIRCQLK
jgi:hypothetical protein